ncbi:citrate synthase, glyoxysomal-like [Hordeum vulgare]|nr:citrate synthase, glyoxysomal-like [Hordeum vulgare]
MEAPSPRAAMATVRAAGRQEVRQRITAGNERVVTNKFWPKEPYVGKCLLNIKITDDYAQAGRGTWSSPSASSPTARTRTASSIASSALCRFHRDLRPGSDVNRTGPAGQEMLMPKDPNATIIMVVVALEKATLLDEYFIERKMYPNVDIYSGLIYRAMGLTTEFFPVLFAIPRVAGWLADWKESLDDPDNKIMRPQQATRKFDVVKGEKTDEWMDLVALLDRNLVGVKLVPDCLLGASS